MKFELDVPFDLDFSLCCGQVFRWHKTDGWWVSVIEGKPLKIRQCRGMLEFEGASEAFVRQYFGLNDDLGVICQSVCKDQVIAKALSCFEGLRIVRQPPWECLIGFECATFKSIAAIEHMLTNICRKYGEKVCFDEMELYAFPSVEKLAVASENGLRECGLGYRAKYVQGTAKKILESGFDLETLKTVPYTEAKKALLEFPGVGAKVADCVLLFSLEKSEAFPVDVWVKRVMLKYYGNLLPQEAVKKMQSHDSLTNTEYELLNGFGRSYFGKYAGYAQEYLYHYERTQNQQ
ncbi:MAG: 8-oxoguanine DNA glycosylase [Candidatus Bathyarchaeota archaeon]|nr:8-oxoguanine DNA glycosylase [Candidatus Bathyarchaeota archaeon]